MYTGVPGSRSPAQASISAGSRDDSSRDAPARNAEMLSRSPCMARPAAVIAVHSAVTFVSISVALAGNHERLVEEPQAGVALQYIPRRLEVAAVPHHFGEPLVLD